MNNRNKSAVARFAKVFIVLNGIIAICQLLTVIFAFIGAYIPSKKAWAFIGIATPLVLAIWKWCAWHKEELESGKHTEEAELLERFLDWLSRKPKGDKVGKNPILPKVSETS